MQRPDLRDIAQPVGGIDQNAVRIAHFSDADIGFSHARDMDHAGMGGEYRHFMRQMVVKRVMYQLEPANGTQGLDRLDRLGFIAQGTDFKTQGFDQTGQIVILQHRFQITQGDAQVALPLSIAHPHIVIARDQADSLGPAGHGDFHQGQRLGGFCGGPVVEPLDLGQGQNAQPLGAGQVTGLCRNNAVKQRLRQIVAHLDPDTAQGGGGVQQLDKAHPGHGHVVQRHRQHGRPPCG